jgi:hypothetical protein
MALPLYLIGAAIAINIVLIAIIAILVLRKRS